MSTTFQFSIPAQSQPQFAFPQRCVCCGAPKQAESTLSISRLVMRGKRQQEVSLKYQIPHCERCARSTKAVFLAGFIPYILGFLTVGGITFLAVTLIASAAGLDNYGQPWQMNSMILGAALGLVAGLIGSFLFELLARVVLLPFFGRGLFQAPMVAAQFITNSDYVAGITAKTDQQAQNLWLTFFNDDIAREFAAANHGPVQG